MSVVSERPGLVLGIAAGRLISVYVASAFVVYNAALNRSTLEFEP